ncbi:MAG: hypothetical protein CBC48_17815 [bacterium TMED88]|nr:hypothetical protein [Deltaproteobacteria bacterium]OUV24156.1 MAG: hypothetical protein CBC48_17815 [bacterium TMED88]
MSTSERRQARTAAPSHGQEVLPRVLNGWDWARMARTQNGRQNLRYELIRIVSGSPSLPKSVSNALVICHGNICRSPFAEALLQSMMPSLSVKSAGLAATGGDPAQPGALRAAREFGFDLSDHRSTPLKRSDLEWADLILGMEGRHVMAVKQLLGGPASNVVTVGDFLERSPHLIPDPWGQSDDYFRRVFAQITAGTEKLYAKLQQQEESCSL